MALLLGAFSVGARPLDMARVYDDPRGLTGTELCYVRTLEELGKLGHVAQGFVGGATGYEAGYDAVVSINEPNLLEPVRQGRRVVWQMLNDFSFVRPGYDAWVDQYFGVSEQHTAHVAARSESPGKWSTIGLGCDPEIYADERIPGRVVWASSADRGLHWLLEAWPEIKASAPQASLHVLYHFSYDAIIDVERHHTSPQGGPYHAHILEVAQRARYIREMLPRLRGLDVTHLGSVSRKQMIREWNEAAVLAYPCDTVAFSEGFSVTTLEAHASYTMPVITDCDCLGSLYRDSGCTMIPRAEIRQALAQAVVDELQRPSPERIAQCRRFAEANTWAKAAKTLSDRLSS